VIANKIAEKTHQWQLCCHGYDSGSEAKARWDAVLSVCSVLPRLPACHMKKHKLELADTSA